MNASVLLVDPKYDFNVGGAQRACALFGADALAWSGERVGAIRPGERLPREERLRDYQHVTLQAGVAGEDFIEGSVEWGWVPIAVECREGSAEPLDSFLHPPKALYVFGPEDGTLGRGILERCHRFVVIPTLIRSPLNLAAAVNVVLYDRLAKERR